MLVLSRKVGERIHIGDQIMVEVRRIAGNRVTLALKAPRDVRILRGELEKAATEFRDEPATACSDDRGAPAGGRQKPVVIGDSLELLSTHDSGTHVAM